MIELPEVYVLADQINKELKGKVIVQAEAGHSPHAFAWYTGNPAEYNSKLAGKKVVSADVFSGSIRVRAGDMILFITTPIRFHNTGDKVPDKHQLYLKFEDGTSITCTIQMWGSLFCFAEGDLNGIPDKYVLSRNLSPLEEEFNESYYNSLLQEGKTLSLSAKAFLATEQRLPGIGNGAAQDILFTAKIHPRRKMSALSESEQKVLFRAIKDVIADMWKKGGRDTENDLYGCRGGYKTILSKNTVNKPCPVCGTIIKKENYLGGSIYFCEECQRL